MGNMNCLCEDNKDLIISNDLLIDDIMKHFVITRHNITQIDDQIRQILCANKDSRMELLKVFLDDICDKETMYDYSPYFKKWIINVVGLYCQFGYLLGLIILPLVCNFENRNKKSSIIANYILDFIGKSKASMYISVRYIIEINTDHIYFVLKSLLIRGNNSIYFKIWSIARKERFMSTVLSEFKRLYNHNYSELRKICDFDNLENEAFSSRNMELAIEQSIFEFIDSKMSCLEGNEIRNSLIRDYFEETGI